MYDDMTYLTLLEFVVKRFNLDLNILFNVSFNLPAIERDITNDEDVEFFIECATNSLYDEIPFLYVRPPKVKARIIPGPTGILQKAMLRKKADVQAGGHENILTTQEYVKKVNEDVSEDDHFTQGPWLMAIVYLHGQGVIASGCLGDVEKYCKNGKFDLVVGVVKSCTPNSLGYMTVTLKDLTGTVGGMIHYKVF
ncbi:integrase, catalytic region, zinc finger, CCHC-type containing protein [Tanacetum coccineum]